MKSVLSLFVVLLTSSFAQAAPKQLACSPISGSSTLFEKLNITLQMPDDQNGSIAPGEWMSQTIDLSYGEAADRAELKVPVKKIDDDNILKGGFEIRYDFGSANLLLVYDYDNDGVVAVIQATTDGPITVETHLCK